MNKADIGILCALREHVSWLLAQSTPLVERDGCWLTEYDGSHWAVALQGRTLPLSYHSAQRVLRHFQPSRLYSFGPSASVGRECGLGRWYEATRCCRLRAGTADGIPSLEEELISPADNAPPERLPRARQLVSADDFVANAALVERLGWRFGGGVVLLDMTGHGVARACREAGVSWRQFRWTTDRAGDTAVTQFTWNVRALAKRGAEVLKLIEEVACERYAAV